jgi:hypothetical protein
VDLEGKAAFKTLFPELFPKLTEFWEKLDDLWILSRTESGGGLPGGLPRLLPDSALWSALKGIIMESGG